MVRLSDLVDNGNGFNLSNKNIKMNRAKIIINKQVDYEFAKNNNVIIYSSIITNIGEKVARDVIFKDEINFGNEFIMDSLYVDFDQIIGVSPINGINIGSIGPGHSKAVSFEVNITDFFKSKNIMNRSCVHYKYSLSNCESTQILDEEFSNFVKLELDNFCGYDNDEHSSECIESSSYILNNDISIEMFASERFATIGDSIKYTITISNNSDVNFYNVIISDIFSDKVKFIEGSIKVWGCELLFGDIQKGINIGDFPIRKTKSITFEVKVVKNQVAIIENRCNARYEYKTCNDEANKENNTQSNLVKVILEKNEITLRKESDKEKTSLLDIITYRVDITNTGSINAFNIFFIDEASENLELVQDSICINGAHINIKSLNGGINLGSLRPRQVYVINYKMKVIGGSYSQESKNCSYVSYDYSLSCGKEGSSQSNNCCNNVKVMVDSFKQIMINADFNIRDKNKKISEIDSINATIETVDTYVIDVMKGISEEGQVSSGKSLIFHGNLEIIMQYTTIDNTMHSQCFEKSFSSIIMIPSDYVDSERTEIVSIVENINSTIISCETISIGVMVLLRLKK